ncbi:MBL fold metallo-hydrolase [Rhizobium sp. LjRoot30]|uniref:MBL fold metallo-hydrolase n=1 Tax=Rhizobium sp. LjRoot30 TaxID=3342320 RepID=UPI003ED0705C
MISDVFRVRFWGVRGSIPVSGPEFQRYGGNTICIEMQCGPHRLLFDAGSGIREAGAAMLAEGVTDINLFFSHCHYDHIVGLPYFMPLYNTTTAVTMWSGHMAGKMTTEDMIRQFMRPPWFPVEPDICRARLSARDFRAGDVLTPHPGIRIKTHNLVHPGGAIGYRVEWAGKTVCFVTDTEHSPGILDPVVLELIRNADLFLYDCTYVDSEMERYRGYGHSTWQQAIRLAKVADAKRIAFIHHLPARTDDELDAIESAAQREFPEAFNGRDRQIIDL